MEATAIVEGFKSSIADRGLVYNFLVADGDSATYQKVLLANPYADLGVRVRKIECKNHQLRRLYTNLRKLCETITNRATRIPHEDPARFIKPKQTVDGKIFAIRMGIDRACSFRGWQGMAGEHIKNLRDDILNSPYHVFGEHAKCASYFCNGQKENEENLVPALQGLIIFPKVMEIVNRVAEHSASLIHNVNNNIVESLNATAMHGTGKKVINYTSRFGYIGRTFRSLLQFNDYDAYSLLHKRLQEGVTPPPLYRRAKGVLFRKRMYSRKHPNRKSWFQQRSEPLSQDNFYGPNAQKPDMTSDTYQRAAERVLKSLQVTPERRKEVEELTRAQSDCDLWYKEREKRITAYKFKRVCALRESTNTAATVKEVVKNSFFGNDATKYGKEFEPVARALLEKLDMKIEDCGFFIHPEHCFLGSSPDGIIRDIDYLVEAKCPYSLPRGKSMKQCIEDREEGLKFWKHGAIQMDYNHAFYYQIQGQLAITDCEVCIFVVFKETEEEKEEARVSFMKLKRS